MKKIMSVDAETNGLYGPVVAIAAIIYSTGGYELQSFEGRTPDETVTNAWCRENVLPAIASITKVYGTEGELLEAFWAFWMKHKDDSAIIAHCAHPVETGMFRKCVERDLPEREFQGPYPFIHEVGQLLDLLGHDGASVDSYIKRNGLNTPAGMVHNPRYDAEAAYVAYHHAMCDFKELKAVSKLMVS